MIDQFIAVFVGNLVLEPFNLLVLELDHFAGLGTNHVIVMLALIDLEHRVTAIEVMPHDQTGALELGQHAVDRRQPHFLADIDQRLVDILGAHMLLVGILKNLQDTYTRQRRLESGFFEILCFHKSLLYSWLRNAEPVMRPRNPERPAAEANYTQSEPENPGAVIYNWRPTGRPPAPTFTHYRAVRIMHAFKRLFAGALTTATLLGLAGCSDYNWRMPGVYRIPVQQGVVLEQSMINRLQPGMDKDEVRFIMGSPVITDPFHNNRWDYVYTFQGGNDQVREQRQVTLHFNEQERLAYITGDVVIGDPNLRAENQAPDDRQPQSFVVPERSKPGFFSRLFGGEPSYEETDDAEAGQRAQENMEVIEDPGTPDADGG